MEITWTTNAGVTKRVVFDTSDEEAPDSTLTITEHPLETGALTSDHAIENPERIQITATVSNTPIRQPETQMRSATSVVASVDLGQATTRSLDQGAQGASAAQYEETQRALSANVLQFSGEFNRVQDVYQELLDLQKNKQVFTLITSLRVWDNALLEGLSFSRNAGSGANSLEFVLTIHQIKFATSQTVEAPQPTQPRGRQQRARGSQNPGEETSEETEEAQNASAIIQLLGI